MYMEANNFELLYVEFSLKLFLNLSHSIEFVVNADVISESPIQHMEHDRSLSGNDTSSSLLLSEDVQLNIEASSVYIPADQMRMIININTAISEV